MTDDTQSHEAPADKFRREAIEFVRFILGAAVVFVIITTVAFRTFYIPSESMQPTLEVQDRVMVLNFVYGWSRHSLQFGVGDFLPEGDGRILGRLPRQGHVIVFRHPNTREHLIKRVIGLPGDVIETREGRLYINGALVARDLRGQVRYRNRFGNVVEPNLYEETLPNGKRHWIYEIDDNPRFHPLDEAGPFTVPEGHVFVMGDNRDASNDSRDPSLSFIPVENIVGRAVTVLFTLHSCRREPGLTCPSGRVWRGL